jgi:hypothetical protein
MEMVIASLGRKLTVRVDGTGDFKTIQAAIAAATSPKSLIEIADSGSYNESLEIPANKEDLTIRGKKGCWPYITLMGDASRRIAPLITIRASGVTLARLFLLHEAPPDRNMRCFLVYGKQFRAQSSIFAMHGGPESIYVDRAGEMEMRDCLVAAETSSYGKTVAVNTLFLGHLAHGPYSLKYCTLYGGGALGGSSSPSTLSTASNCILLAARGDSFKGVPMENCNVAASDGSAPSEEVSGEGVTSASPQFVNAAELDLHLAPGSPCAGKGSDGKDLGCRFTAEMDEMLKLARAAHTRGLLRF